MSNWIKCSDQLPEKDVMVLLYYGDLDMFPMVIGKYFEEGGWEIETPEGDIYMDEAPTHWMPLPEKPED